MPDPITTGPNPQPVEQTQDVATPDQLQAPAPAPAQQPVQLAPTQQSAQPVTTPPVPPSPNQRLHSFVSSVLGGITKNMAGQGPTKYTTDTAGRVVADPNQPQESTGDKLRRIGANALTGLSAGSQVPQQKSGLASALAGLGAGAQAQKAGAQAMDDKARKQEQENAEAAAQKELRMHTIGRGNALTYATYQEQRRLDEDRDPHRAQAMGWAKAAEDAGVPVEYASESDLQQRRESDPSFIATHQILPIGMKPVLGPDGQPVRDESGQPEMEGQFALIDGLHKGNIAVPESFVSDVQKYGKLAGVTGMDSLKPGEDMSMEHFTKLFTAIQEGKKKEMDGWAKPELAWTGPNHDIPVQINPNTGESKPFSKDPSAIPNAANKPEQTDTKNALTEAQTAEAKAKTQEALANAAQVAQQLGAGGSGTFDQSALPDYIDAVSKLPAQSQALLKAVRPQDQMALLKVAAGDAELAKTFPTRTTAKSGQMDAQHATSLVALLNPDYNSQYYKAVQEATDDMVKGGGHKGTLSFGQFLVHADDVRQGSMRLARVNSPWLNESVSAIRQKGMGNPEINKLQTDIMAARSEWETFINSNHVASSDDKKAGATLMDDNSTPAQIMGVLGEMGKQAVGRLDQINEGYKTVTHRDWPNLIPPMSRQAAVNLGLGSAISKYGSGGTLRGAMGGSGNGSPVTEQPKAANAPAGAITRPQDVPKATGVAPGSDGKMYWHDASGAVLRALTPEESKTIGQQ